MSFSSLSVSINYFSSYRAQSREALIRFYQIVFARCNSPVYYVSPPPNRIQSVDGGDFYYPQPHFTRTLIKFQVYVPICITHK